MRINLKINSGVSRGPILGLLLKTGQLFMLLPWFLFKLRSCHRGAYFK